MSQGSNFVDYVKICCRSGKGGAGSAHLHRDKRTAIGGPDGGDGGRGGHIILKGNTQFWTLLAPEISETHHGQRWRTRLQRLVLR